MIKITISLGEQFDQEIPHGTLQNLNISLRNNPSVPDDVKEDILRAGRAASQVAGVGGAYHAANLTEFFPVPVTGFSTTAARQADKGGTVTFDLETGKFKTVIDPKLVARARILNN